MPSQLHAAQVSILQTLRHVPSARFSELMKPTGLESDTFKFHVRKLTHLGLVQKDDNGVYSLTPKGKEYANNLDSTRRTAQRQPKVSILLLVPRPGDMGVGDERQFLFQARLRNPYFGFWSCIGGPIRWGESAEDAAAQELKKQTGLTAICTTRLFCRQRDYADSTGELLEDKLFVVLTAAEVQGELTSEWRHGTNVWMALKDFRNQPKLFDSVPKAIDALDAGLTYFANETRYSLEDY